MKLRKTLGDGVSRLLQRRSQRWQTESQFRNLSQWDLSANDKGHIEVEGVDVVELIEQYGSPLFVCNYGRLAKDALQIKNALSQMAPGGKVLYSYKTNCIPAILEQIHDLGIGAEVVSPYELWLANELGVAGNMIVYNGVSKTEESIRRAIAMELLAINIDSLEEIDRIYSLARQLKQKTRVGVRIGFETETQFGLDIQSDEIMEACDLIAALSDYLDFHCLHFNTVTNTRNANIHKLCAVKAVEFMHLVKMRHDISISYLDIGGGFGVPTVKTLSKLEYGAYRMFGCPPRPPVLERFQPIESWLSEVIGVIERECYRRGLETPKIIIEPGRYVTSRSQFLLTRVQSIKGKKDGTPFVITESGRYSSAFPCGFEYHEIFVANRADEFLARAYHLVGRVCSAGDWIAQNRLLPELQPGDIIAIMDSGAYFSSYSSNFSFPRPAVVMVSDGKSRILRREESFEHLTAMDIFA